MNKAPSPCYIDIDLYLMVMHHLMKNVATCSIPGTKVGISVAFVELDNLHAKSHIISSNGFIVTRISNVCDVKDEDAYLERS